ncbi:BLUF domain-containing protein [Naasia lichenicola]|uniref:BLUF domain-containing protein n=1 Tax=Naasia lichenicola TaxID=2565933 RepID=A0A4S4FJM1_9MICO|nr:BLUF domain-containing protein [Naasia lichenicola]
MTSVSVQSGSLSSVVYSSTEALPFSDEDLVALLGVSRRNNERNSLTGMLLYREGRFLQVLEGPPEAVESRLAIIRSDDRHQSMRIMFEEKLDERQFAGWAMGFPADSIDDPSGIPGYLSTFDNLASDPDSTITLRITKELIKWFEDRSS